MSVKVFTHPEENQKDPEKWIPTQEFYFEIPLLPDYSLEISHYDQKWQISSSNSNKIEYIKSFIINPWDYVDGLPFVFTWKSLIMDDEEHQEEVLFKNSLNITKDGFYKDSKDFSPLIESEF